MLFHFLMNVVSLPSATPSTTELSPQAVTTPQFSAYQYNQMMKFFVKLSHYEVNKVLDIQANIAGMEFCNSVAANLNGLWIIDSGASHHMACTANGFIIYKRVISKKFDCLMGLLFQLRELDRALLVDTGPLIVFFMHRNSNTI